MIAILLGNGFEEAEALIPADYLRRAELDVKTVSLYNEDPVSGGHGIVVKADCLLKDLRELPEALILPGGLGGVSEMERSPAATELIRRCCEENKVVGAICAAPTLLSRLGLLENKRVTCYPDMKQQLSCKEWLDAPVVTDGKLVTSMAAGTASEFAFALIEALKDPQSAQEVKNSIYFPRELEKKETQGRSCPPLKQELRRRMKKMRLDLNPDERESFAKSAAESLFAHPMWKKAEAVALYSPIHGELDPVFVWQQAKKENKRLLYPRCEGMSMSFYPVEDPTAMPIGSYGIPEPDQGAPVTDFSRTLVLVPSLAVDEKLYRVGWGGGYYDRFLATHRVLCKLGFVYSFQRTGDICPQSWDASLDGVITP